MQQAMAAKQRRRGRLPEVSFKLDFTGLALSLTLWLHLSLFDSLPVVSER